MDGDFRALLHNVPFSDTVKTGIRRRRDLANAFHAKLKREKAFTQYGRKLEEILEQYYFRMTHLADRAANEFPRDDATLEEEVQEVSVRLDSLLKRIADHLDEGAASELRSLRNRAFFKVRDLASNLGGDSRLPKQDLSAFVERKEMLAANGIRRGSNVKLAQQHHEQAPAARRHVLIPDPDGEHVEITTEHGTHSLLQDRTVRTVLFGSLRRDRPVYWPSTDDIDMMDRFEAAGQRLPMPDPYGERLQTITEHGTRSFLLDPVEFWQYADAMERRSPSPEPVARVGFFQLLRRCNIS